MVSRRQSTHCLRHNGPPELRPIRLTRFTVLPRRCSPRIGPRPAARVRATARTKRRFEHGPLGAGQVHAIEYDGDHTDVQAASVFMRQLLGDARPVGSSPGQPTSTRSGGHRASAARRDGISRREPFESDRQDSGKTPRSDALRRSGRRSHGRSNHACRGSFISPLRNGWTAASASGLRAERCFSGLTKGS